MAEKGFGVKEINLIGASGTPTIESPNNLNLNAVNVAISTNATIGGNLTVSGTVGIAGTLTYEDVTNIDSVGIVTAQKDIHVGAGLSVVGVSTLTGAVNSSANITTTLDLNSRYLYVKDIFMEDVSPELRFVDTDNDPNYRIRLNSGLLGIRDITNNVDKLVFNTSGMVATGIVTATTFSGSGASLTNLPLSNTDVQVLYTLTANGSSAYRFAGNGIVSTEDNPDVYLIRGLKYRFVNNSGGSHPFQIRQSSGGSAYSAGVTNNGAASGNIDFQVPYSAPSRLYYQCTSHGGMVGNLYIRGAGGQNDNVGVTTFSGAVNVTAAITADDFRTDSSSSTLYLTSANDWRFRTTSGAERLRILSSGKINIGNTDLNQTTDQFCVSITASNAADNVVRFQSAAAASGTSESLVKIYKGAGYGGAISGYITQGSDHGMKFYTADNSSLTERLRISKLGITKPSNPAFHARPPGSYSLSGDSVIGGTWSTSDAESFVRGTLANGNSIWNNGTGIFTVPVTGIYYIHWSVFLANNTTRRDAMIYNGNTIIARTEIGDPGESGNNKSVSVSTVVSLTVNDEIKFGALTTGGTTIYQTVRPWSYACAHLVG